MFATYTVHGGREGGRERVIAVGREIFGDRRIKGERREIHSERKEGGRDGRMEGVNTHAYAGTHARNPTHAHAHTHAHTHTRASQNTHTHTYLYICAA